MIPSIETICEDLAAGRITVQQAIAWMNAHAEGGMTDLRDHFAGLAMQGLLSDPKLRLPWATFASDSYAMADAMLEARK